MQMEPVQLPFASGAIEEVPLASSPLVSVLFQVRFPRPVSKIASDLASRQLQTELADSFPYAEQQDSFDVVIAPGQPATTRPGEKTWTLTSDSGSRILNIAAESISLTVLDYDSRDDLVAELSGILTRIGDIVKPPQISRIGVRYLNRVVDDGGDLGGWISNLAEGARGILATQGEQHDENILFSLSQVVYKYPDANHGLQARWGLIPSGAVIDASMQAVDPQSWILDLDTFIEEPQAFDPASITKSVAELAQRSYRFFRWVVTPTCLKRFQPGDVSATN